MSVRSAQAITIEFTTSSPTTQAALNADSTPTVTLVLNGVDNGASVTVTNVDTGRYKAAVTLPTLAIGDITELSVAATVGGIAGKAIVWRDTKDVLLDSSGDVTFNNTAIGTVTTLSNLPAAPTDWLAAAAVKADAVTKIQLGLATPTNITAGTITTATNLTNLPSIPNNWLTAAGIASDADAEIAGAVWDLATSGHTTSGTFGAANSSTSGGPTASVIASAVWNEINTGATHNLNNSAGKQLRSLSGNSTAIYSSTIPNQAGMTSTTVKLDPGASSSNGTYEGAALWATTGTGQGGGICTHYVGSTRVATINVAWDVQPVENDVVEVMPTGYSIVAGYLTGQDPSTLVWAGATRTLTDLPVMPTDWVTAIGVSAAAVTKIQAGLSTYAGGDTSGTNTLLSRLTGTRATLLDNLSRLDTTVSSRSTYSGGDTAGTTTLLARLTATRAGNMDNLPNLDAAISTRATNAGAADALLGRSVTGGADGGRTVSQAFYFLRNRWTIAGGTLSVYETNDSSVSWTGAVSTAAGNPVTGVDPA